MSDASNVLSKIPGELLGPTRNGLPQAHRDGSDTRRVIIHLPDGARAEVTFVKLKRKEGKTTRWFWSPDSAVLIDEG